MNKVLLLILIIGVVSCNNKKTISDKYFEIEVVNEQTPGLIDDVGFNDVEINYSGLYKQNKQTKINYIQHTYFHTQNIKRKYFSNTFYEIFFDRSIAPTTSLPKHAFCLIGVNDKYKAFYIFWINKRGYEKPYEERIEMNIGEYTESIYSNIDVKTIKDLFPNFKGQIIKKVINKVILDYSKWNALEVPFYNQIKLDSFYLGSPFF